MLMLIEDTYDTGAWSRTRATLVGGERSHTDVARGSIPGFGVIIMWVEFVVGSRPCSEVFLQVLWFSPLVKNLHFQISIGPGFQSP